MSNKSMESIFEQEVCKHAFNCIFAFESAAKTLGVSETKLAEALKDGGIAELVEIVRYLGDKNVRDNEDCVFRSEGHSFDASAWYESRAMDILTKLKFLNPWIGDPCDPQPIPTSERTKTILAKIRKDK